MFDLEKEGRTAIQEVKICFGDLVGSEKEDVWVTLAEPDTFDCLKLKSQPKDVISDPNYLVGFFKEIFPKYIVDHGFCKGSVKATTEEVTEFIFRKMSVADYVTGEYFRAVFLSPQSKTKER